jgi:hypothetical protein
MLKKGYTYSLGLLLIVLVLSDILTLFIPAVGAVGTGLWYLSYLYLIVFAGWCLHFIIKQSLAQRSAFSLAVILLFMGLIIIHAGNPKSLSGETSIEINCAIEKLQSSPDRGFHQTCLFGYPARQFFLPALPTLLFDRSLFALNIGGGIYFLLGVIIFSAGVIKYLNKPYSDLIAGILSISLLHYYYVSYFLFQYEQSIFPLSFTLMLLGIYLFLKQQWRLACVLLGSLILYYLIFSYTPSLAVIVLAMAVIAARVFSHKEFSSKSILIAIMIAVLGITYISFQFRTDIRLGNTEERSYSQLAIDGIKATEYLFYPNTHQAYTSSLFHGLMILTLILPFTGLFGKHTMAVSLWIIATIGFSIISRGYTYYGISFRAHRSMVVIPLILYLQLIIIKHAHLIGKNVRLLVLIFFFLSTTAVVYHLRFINDKSISPHYPVIEWLMPHLPSTMATTLYVTNDAQQVNNLISLRDTFIYFRPQTTVINIHPDERFLVDCNLDIPPNSYLLLTANNPCFPLLSETVAFKNLPEGQLGLLRH